MIKLKRLNVVKIVNSEFRAQQLERQGFKRVEEPDKDKNKDKAKNKYKAEGGE